MISTTTRLLGVYDEVGRYLGPAEVVIQTRPMGPWNDNASVLASSTLTVICAWCPDFDRTAPINEGATHGICPSCQAKVEAGWAA